MAIVAMVVVMVVMVVAKVVIVIVMMVWIGRLVLMEAMLVLRRSCIRAAYAKDRHRKCECEPENGDERLFHESFSFFL